MPSKLEILSHQTDSPPLWRQIMRKNFVSWQKLAEFLQLTEEMKAEIEKRPRFPLNLPMRLAEKIQKGTLDDPILKQFLPTTEEGRKMRGFSCDPVGDHLVQKGPKLLQKYHGRALLLTTSSCAMHCRYCFRQNYDYETKRGGYSEEIAAIQSDPTLHEVILSGGDPLSLSDRELEPLLRHLCSIPHVKHIRFHTRFPIGIPERIDESFIKILKKLPVQIWFVIHCNHPAELDDEVIARLNELKRCGVTLLNQSVLLKGVNDSAKTLVALSQALIDGGILPYYLHQLDRVEGSAHFEVEEARGRALIEQMRVQLPGYAVPRYVQEISGKPSKTPL